MKSVLILLTSLIFIAGGINAQTNVSEVKITTSAQCDMCKKRIEDGLYSQKGVIEANLDINTKIITLKFRNNKTSEAILRNYISSLGYNADDVPANKEAYDKLPGCCQIGGH